MSSKNLYTILMFSVQSPNLFLGNERIAGEHHAVKRLSEHVNGAYLMVIIGGAVVYAPVGIHAAGVKRYLICSVFKYIAPRCWVNGVENMEKLADALAFRISLETELSFTKATRVKRD